MKQNQALRSTFYLMLKQLTNIYRNLIIINSLPFVIYQIMIQFLQKHCQFQTLLTILKQWKNKSMLLFPLIIDIKKLIEQKILAHFANLEMNFKQIIITFKQNYVTQNEISQLKQVYHHGICGKNHYGNLVVVDRIGTIKMSEIHKVLDEDSIIAYFNQRLLHISEKILSQKQQVVWVIDLHGKIMQLASKKLLTLLSKIIKNLQTYFPNILYKMYLVNTPMLFDSIWNKFCDQISEQTQQKIIMLGDEIEPLYEDVDSSMLPEFLGGELDQDLFLRDCVQQFDHNKENQKIQDKDEQEEEEEQQFDFASLKQALSGMKLGGLQSVNQTPLNTEADDN